MCCNQGPVLLIYLTTLVFHNFNGALPSIRRMPFIEAIDNDTNTIMLKKWTGLFYPRKLLCTQWRSLCLNISGKQLITQIITTFHVYSHKTLEYMLLQGIVIMRGAFLHLNRSQAKQGGNPDSKVHGAKMGPIWGRQDPGGPHVGPMNLAI